MKKCPNGLENVRNRSEMISLTLGNNIKTIREEKRTKGLIFARVQVLGGEGKKNSHFMIFPI